MAWAGPSHDQPVWCAGTGKNGPTAQQVTCTTTDPSKGQAEGLQRVSLNLRSAGMGQELPGSGTRLQPHPLTGEGATISDTPLTPASYQVFTNQMDLGRFLTEKYHIRTANELSSCEVCHR